MTDDASDPAVTIGERVRSALSDAGHGQAWLGQEVARIEGRSEPYSQGRVSQWLAEIERQPPARVFAIEEALEMPAGALSRLLGYLPASAVPAMSVPAAIEADRRLDGMGRSVLLAAYRAATKRRT